MALDYLVALEDKNFNRSSSEMRIYPTISHQSYCLKLNSGKNESANLEVYAITGKLVHTLRWSDAQDDSFNFSLKDLPQGVYILRVRHDKGTSIAKLILVN